MEIKDPYECVLPEFDNMRGIATSNEGEQVFVVVIPEWQTPIFTSSLIEHERNQLIVLQTSTKSVVMGNRRDLLRVDENIQPYYWRIPQKLLEPPMGWHVHTTVTLDGAVIYENTETKSNPDWNLL